MSNFLDIVILELFGVQLTSEIQTEIYFDLQKIGRLMLKNFPSLFEQKDFFERFFKVGKSPVLVANYSDIKKNYILGIFGENLMNEIIFKKIFELFLGGQIRQRGDFGSAQFFSFKRSKKCQIFQILLFSDYLEFS